MAEQVEANPENDVNVGDAEKAAVAEREGR
jgi:hypothetical protein